MPQACAGHRLGGARVGAKPDKSQLEALRVFARSRMGTSWCACALAATHSAATHSSALVHSSRAPARVVHQRVGDGRWRGRGRGRAGGSALPRDNRQWTLESRRAAVSSQLIRSSMLTCLHDCESKYTYAPRSYALLTSWGSCARVNHARCFMSKRHPRRQSSFAAASWRYPPC